MTPLALTPPAIEPVSLSEAKDFLRILADDEDELLGTLITAARLMIEAASGRLFSRSVHPRASTVPPARLYLAHPGHQACARRKVDGAGGQNRGVSRCHG